MLYIRGGNRITPEPKIGPIIRPERVSVFSFLFVRFDKTVLAYITTTVISNSFNFQIKR